MLICSCADHHTDLPSLCTAVFVVCASSKEAVNANTVELLLGFISSISVVHAANTNDKIVMIHFVYELIVSIEKDSSILLDGQMV